MSFSKISSNVTKAAGHPVAFLLCLLVVLVWLIYGFILHWNTEHALFISNVGTPITLLLVFLIQSSQNKDTKVLHMKLDEILRAIEDASDDLRGIEVLSEKEIEEIKNKL